MSEMCEMKREIDETAKGGAKMKEVEDPGTTERGRSWKIETQWPLQGRVAPQRGEAVAVPWT